MADDQITVQLVIDVVDKELKAALADFDKLVKAGPIKVEVDFSPVTKGLEDVRKEIAGLTQQFKFNPTINVTQITQEIKGVGQAARQTKQDIAGAFDTQGLTRYANEAAKLHETLRQINQEQQFIGREKKQPYGPTFPQFYAAEQQRLLQEQRAAGEALERQQNLFEEAFNRRRNNMQANLAYAGIGGNGYGSNADVGSSSSQYAGEQERRRRDRELKDRLDAEERRANSSSNLYGQGPSYQEKLAIRRAEEERLAARAAEEDAAERRANSSRDQYGQGGGSYVPPNPNDPYSFSSGGQAASDKLAAFEKERQEKLQREKLAQQRQAEFARRAQERAQIEQEREARRVRRLPQELRNANRRILFANGEDFENIDDIRESEADRLKVSPNQLIRPNRLDARRLSNPETLIQLGFAATFGGPASFLGGLAGGVTPLGPAGALLGSTLADAFTKVFDNTIDAIKEKAQEIEEAGLTLNRSILGIASIRSANLDLSNGNGTPLRANQTGLGLEFQTAQARQIQLAARSRLLPLGIAGGTEATFVQGIVSALAQRGIQATPDQVARIASSFGGAIQTQRPGLLDNTQQLLKDLEDVIGGGPTAQRTILGQLVRPALSALGKATTGEEIASVSERFLGGFGDAATKIDNPVAVQNRLAGAIDNLKTLSGDEYLAKITPALKELFSVLSNPSTIEAASKVAGAVGNVTSALIRLGSAQIDTLANRINEPIKLLSEDLPNALRISAEAILAFTVTVKALAGLPGLIDIAKTGLLGVGENLLLKGAGKGVLASGAGEATRALGNLFFPSVIGASESVGAKVVGGGALGGILKGLSTTVGRGSVLSGVGGGILGIAGLIPAALDISAEVSKLDTQAQEDNDERLTREIIQGRLKFSEKNNPRSLLNSQLTQFGLKDDIEGAENSRRGSAFSRALRLGDLLSLNPRKPVAPRDPVGTRYIESYEEFDKSFYDIVPDDLEDVPGAFANIKFGKKPEPEVENPFDEIRSVVLAQKAEADRALGESRISRGLDVNSTTGGLSLLRSRSGLLTQEKSTLEQSLQAAQDQLIRAQRGPDTNAIRDNGRDIQKLNVEKGLLEVERTKALNDLKDAQRDKGTKGSERVKEATLRLQKADLGIADLDSQLKPLQDFGKKLADGLNPAADKARNDIEESLDKIGKNFQESADNSRAIFNKIGQSFEQYQSTISQNTGFGRSLVARAGIANAREQLASTNDPELQAQAQARIFGFEQQQTEAIRQGGLEQVSGVNGASFLGRRRIAQNNVATNGRVVASLANRLAAISGTDDASNARRADLQLQLNRESVAGEQARAEADFNQPKSQLEGLIALNKAGQELANETNNLAKRFNDLDSAVFKATNALEDFENERRLRQLGTKGELLNAADRVLKAGGTANDVPIEVSGLVNDPEARKRFELELAREQTQALKRKTDVFRIGDEEDFTRTGLRLDKERRISDKDNFAQESANAKVQNALNFFTAARPFTEGKGVFESLPKELQETIKKQAKTAYSSLKGSNVNGTNALGVFDPLGQDSQLLNGGATPGPLNENDTINKLLGISEEKKADSTKGGGEKPPELASAITTGIKNGLAGVIKEGLVTAFSTELA